MSAARLTLLLALSLHASAVHAEVCTVVADSGIETQGGVSLLDSPTSAWCDVSGWSGALPASAALVVASGVELTLRGDLIQAAGGSPPAGVTVGPGGALRAEVGANGATPGAGIRLVLGEAGLVCGTGSTCAFAGRFRTSPESPPSTTANPSPWVAAGTVPCPDAAGSPDCNATTSARSIGRLELGEIPGAGAPGVAAVEPGVDVACFWDFDPTDHAVPVDVSYCYDVVGASPDSPRPFVDFDVDQGVLDQAGFPLARRRLVETSLAVAAEPGARDVCIDGTAPSLAALDADGSLIGRWLRFEDATGAAGDRSDKILDTRVDDPAGCGAPGRPRVRIGDRDGLPEPRAAGSRVWIDYGWASGDSFFVLAPVRIGSATAAGHDGTVVFDGALDLFGVVFDGTGQIDVRGSLDRWTHVWGRDVTGSLSTEAEQIFFSTVDGTVGHTVLTGGSDQSTCAPPAGPGSGFDACDRLHGITVENGTLEFEDIAARHGQDDLFWVSWGGHANIRRVRSSFASDSMVTGNLLNSRDASNTYSIVDGVCDDCVGSPDGAGMAVFQSNGPGSVDRFLSWGNVGPLEGGSPSAVVSMRDVAVIGGGNDGVGRPLLPSRIERFLVREAVVRHPQDSGFFDRLTVDVRDGIIIDSVAATPRFALLPKDGIVENVAIVDPSLLPSVDCSLVDCAVLGSIGSQVDSRSRNLSVVFHPGGGAENLETVYDVVNHPGTGVEVSGLLVSGFGGAAAFAALDADWAGWASAIDWGGSICLHDSDPSFRPEIASGFDGVAIVEDPPGFVNPAALRFDTSPGGAAAAWGCGVRSGGDAPGVRGYRWFHAVSRLEPERMANDVDGDGVVVAPASDACESGEWEDCSDSCPFDFDPGQQDSNGDGRGDACTGQCTDGVDNDGDGAVDYPADAGCRNATPLSREEPACQDGRDNDGDGLGDALDPECHTLWWTDEGTPMKPSGGCGLGGEAVVAVVVWFALRRRRREGDPGALRVGRHSP